MYFKHNQILHKSKQSLKSLKDPIFFINQENIDQAVNTSSSPKPQCISGLEYISTFVITQELSANIGNLTALGVEELWNDVSAQSDTSILSDPTCPPPYPAIQSIFFVP